MELKNHVHSGSAVDLVATRDGKSCSRVQRLLSVILQNQKFGIPLWRRMGEEGYKYLMLDAFNVHLDRIGPPNFVVVQQLQQRCAGNFGRLALIAHQTAAAAILAVDVERSATRLGSDRNGYGQYGANGVGCQVEFQSLENHRIRFNRHDLRTGSSPTGYEQTIHSDIGSDVQKREVVVQSFGQQRPFHSVEQLRSEQDAFFAEIVVRMKAHVLVPDTDIDRMMQPAEYELPQHKR